MRSLHCTHFFWDVGYIDVGDEMSWWQLWDVGYRFKMLLIDFIHLNHQHNEKRRQHYFVTKITLLCHQDGSFIWYELYHINFYKLNIYINLHFQLFQPLVPNTVDEQNEHDDQIAVEIVNLTKNDNNNLPKLLRNKQAENSYRVTPSGLVMEENKSPPRDKRKIYMIVPSSEPLLRISDSKNDHQNSLVPTPDQNAQHNDHETSNNDRLYSILDFPISNLWWVRKISWDIVSDIQYKLYCITYTTLIMNNKAILPSASLIEWILRDSQTMVDKFSGPKVMARRDSMIVYGPYTCRNETIWLVVMNVKVD